MKRTEYDEKPEVMRLLNLFGKHKIYWDKDFKAHLSCLYWRGYLLRRKDNTLFKNMPLYIGLTGDLE